MKNEIKVGVKVYKELLGRYSNKQKQIKECIVTKIGKTYFYLDNRSEKINLNTLRFENKNYPQYNFQVYLTEEEIRDKWELSDLYDKISDCFRWSNRTQYTLNQLREVAKVLHIEN